MGTELTVTVLACIPVEYQGRFADLSQRPTRDATALREALSTYLATVHRVAKFVVALDAQLAARIGATCLALLDRSDSKEKLKVVSTLITYFIEEEEDEDITGVLGLDDDLQVTNAVCRAFEATDLILERS